MRVRTLVAGALIVAAPFVAWGGLVILFASSSGGDVFTGGDDPAGQVGGTLLLVAGIAAFVTGLILLARRQ